MMKLLFISNFYTHHQKQLCEQWYRLTKHSFTFLTTEPFSEERKQMGWGMENPPFVKDGLNAGDEQDVMQADAVIFGSAPRMLLNQCLRQGKPVFLYSERIYRSGYEVWKWPARLIRFWQRYGRFRNFYLLCASAYTQADYAKHFTFRNKAYKWGYFPATETYELPDLMARKKRSVILWCGRFLDLKHPDDGVEVARRLKAAGVPFELRIIGTGEMEKQLREQIASHGLQDCVTLLGSMSPEQVRMHMEEAGIYLFTSDFNEGWGAVLNESMNSGCAVVASHAIGSVPYLLKHKENGMIYKNGDVDDLYNKVRFLLDNPEQQQKLGEAAYHTIVDLWSGEVAAERFLRLTEEIKDHGYCDLYEDGPCSRAPRIKNNWFRG